MTKKDYLEMLSQENNEGKTQKLYSDVLDCLDIALSQENDDFEIADTSIGLKELYGIIERRAKGTGAHCVGPFEAAEIFAEKFGAKYTRLSKRGQAQPRSKLVNLEDFF